MNQLKTLTLAMLMFSLAASAQDPAVGDAPEVDAAPAIPADIQAAPPPREIEVKRMPRLTVVVEGLQPETGSVEISLFNSAEDFMVKPMLQESWVPDADGKVSMTFRNVFEGEYGLVIVHDANGNGLFDSGFLGFGAEPVGYSNNVRPWLGRPAFDEVRFDVQEDTEVTINMQ